MTNMHTNTDTNNVSFMDFISTIDKYDSLKPIIDQVSNMINIDINIIPSKYPMQSGPSFKQYKNMSNDEKNNIHFMRICSPSYLKLKSSLIPLVSPSIIDYSYFNLPLINPPNIINLPLYYSVFITNNKNNIYTKNDIINYDKKNKLILSVNDIHSLSGYHCIKLWLSENKLLNNTNCPFKKIIKSGAHLKSIKLIQNGIADIALIDIYVLLSYLKANNYKYNGFRILSDGIIGPYHAPIITVTKQFVKKYNLDIQQLKTMFVKAFNNNKFIAQKLKNQMLIGGFVKCNIESLEKIQQLLEKAGTNLIKLPHQNYNNNNKL